ncbi:hypothetical protein PR048_013091 [Dryococelus australis]|uniref:Uncharacterized protein n=1 Tax=Dryococelus australis TaxID=614101 RepID=A0ABQ9HR79_9NEOP|nr:hypothetical protein PR048_013091 [Dryococelus australis]
MQQRYEACKWRPEDKFKNKILFEDYNTVVKQQQVVQVTMNNIRSHHHESCSHGRMTRAKYWQDTNCAI